MSDRVRKRFELLVGVSQLRGSLRYAQLQVGVQLVDFFFCPLTLSPIYDRRKSMPPGPLRVFQSAESSRSGSYVQKPVDFEKFQQIVQQLGLYWLIVNQTPAAKTSAATASNNSGDWRQVGTAPGCNVCPLRLFRVDAAWPRLGATFRSTPVFVLYLAETMSHCAWPRLVPNRPCR
jgi:hypothetical protein